LKQETQEE